MLTPEPQRHPLEGNPAAPHSLSSSPEGQLSLGGTPLVDLAETYGTPLYLLDAATIRNTAQAYVNSFKQAYPQPTQVFYACKANLSRGLATLLHQEGVGFDVVSAGELQTVLSAGVSPQHILMNGNNKSQAELLMAVETGVSRIVVDNFDELKRLDSVCSQLNQKANILLRVAPGIECHTHDYIKTGQNDSKFGFGLWDLPQALEQVFKHYSDTLKLKGLQAHIGSQIFELQAYEDLAKTLLNMLYNIRQEYDVTLEELDLGGGLGIAYTEADDPQPVETFVQRLCAALIGYANELQYPLPNLMVEPGRSLLARAGMTLYRVGGRKAVPDGPTFVSVDGGMGDNIRPALYQAEYQAVVVNKAFEQPTETVRLVGKYCESGDVVLRAFETPRLEEGDIVAVLGTGAYNEAMASTYNRIPRPATVLVEEGQHALLLRRETVDDLLLRDQVPSWLEQKS